MIRRIRFNVKTRHRIYPDALCATKWFETKPLLCKVYSDALFRLRFSRRMCARVCVRVWKTTDVSGFAMTSFFMVAVCADWPCVHRSWQIARVLAGKILPHRRRRNTSGDTRDVPFTFVSVHKDDSQARAIFFFFFFRNINTHAHAYIILLRANELISILDTSVKSSWNFSTVGQILIFAALTTVQLGSSDDNQGDVRAEFVKLISAHRNNKDAKYASHCHR